MNRRITTSLDSQIDEKPTASKGEAGGMSAKAPKAKKAGGGKKPAKDGKAGSGDVGNILRGAYRQTVEEAIPDDLMDLLNRLE